MTEEIGPDTCRTDIRSLRHTFSNLIIRKDLEQALSVIRYLKSTDESFSAIPGGELHPQAVAPGYQMYTCWMIRHIDGNPWLQTDRCEDERYTWLHDAEF